MTHKDIAIAFLHAAASGNVRDAYETYVHPDFFHHNPYFKGDRQSLLEAMEESAARDPNKTIDVVRALEEGDMVATHSRIVREDSGAPEIAAVHIFRFQDDLIIEEWEVGMEVPHDSLNEHDAF